ncbi:MAG: formylmethanofuran dehydrogenase [Filomicrobium sp.]
MSESADASTFENVVCPFCGLLCDDLQVNRDNAGLKVLKNGCARASSGFERQVLAATPQISGKDASLEDAVTAAAAMIKKASLPMYGGLSTDVSGMRAAMSLADRTRGLVEHAYSYSVQYNMNVLQSAGYIMSTLTETRNRADLIVIAGSDIHEIHPRFFERIVRPAETLFEDGPKKRTVVFVGDSLDQSGVTGDTNIEAVTLPCPLERADEVMAAVLARLREKPVTGEEVAGVSIAAIEDLASRLREAEYSVVVWSTSSLKTAEPALFVHTLCEAVKLLNRTTRSAGLSLGGNEGAPTATAVCGWQSGYPMPISFASGAPEYDPETISINEKIASGEGDLLLWVASITPEPKPPDTNLPMIVLGTPGLKLDRQPDIFIPVGTPGLDHDGQIIRNDSTVSLPLRSLRPALSPSVAEVLSAIEAKL